MELKMLKYKMKLMLLLAVLTLSTQSIAGVIFSSADDILGGYSDFSQFLVGDECFNSTENCWPGGEDPTNIIDGFGQKYLNFIGDESPSGVIITASIGSTIADSIKLWTANDAESRDPASFELYGTNIDLTGSAFSLNLFDLIANGPLALPSSRNNGGAGELLDINSQTISFSNSNAYSSYLVLFPTVKDADNANSTQIAEIQLFGEVAQVPEPSTLAIFALSIIGFASRKFKK